MPEISTAPNLSALYVKAVAPRGRRGSELPDTEYVRRDVEIDRHHLADYNRVCGFDLRDELPATYPHILSFGMSVRLMTNAGFPFPLLGLVHVANTIEQRRPLRITEPLTLRVRAENLRAHPKGRQFDIVTEAGAGDEVVWREASTYLRRGQRDESAPRENLEFDGDPSSWEPTAKWRAPSDLGRRYAAVTGDRNPIHLHPLTAKLFGFRRNIAHGMWSKARCLAAFTGRMPDSCTVRTEFRQPVLLPSTVDFTERPNSAGRDFALLRAGSDSAKPHLLGTLRPGVS